MDEVAEVSVVRVALVREAVVPYKVGGPSDAVELAHRLLGDRDREVFLVLCADTKLVLNAAYIAAIGSLDHCPIHPREVFKAALLSNAASVILAHCHPSGDPTPSPDDYAITQRLVDAGEILGVPVQDHVIVGSLGRAWSFRAAGEMPTCRQIAEPGSARPGRAPCSARPGPG
jgi:DNA repair protein RadC